MQILSIYWKSILASAMTAQPARRHAHTREERLAFERRMAAMRAEDRRYVHWNG